MDFKLDEWKELRTNCFSLSGGGSIAESSTDPKSSIMKHLLCQSNGASFT